MTDNITWTNSTRKLSDLIPWEINPAQIGKDEAKRLEESLTEFGQIQTIAISPTNEIYDGHQRQAVWGASRKFGKDYEVDVRVSSRELTEQERKKLVIYLRKGTVGTFDWDILANNFEISDLLEWGFRPFELGLNSEGNDPNEEWQGMPEFGNEDLQGIIIKVHFADEVDRKEFAKKLGIHITDKTNSMWYPERPENLKNQLGTGLVYTDES